MGKRQEEALKTRQKLIDAVRALGNEKSFQDVSIEEITTKAGVAKGTFYVYFKRKEDVISELAYTSFDDIKKSTMQLTGIADRIRHFLIQSTQVIRQNTLEVGQQWLRCAVASLEGENHGIEKLRYDEQFLSECIADAIASGELKEDTPISVLADLLIAQYYGSLTLWCMTDGEKEMEKLISAFCECQLEGILTYYRR